MSDDQRDPSIESSDWCKWFGGGGDGGGGGVFIASDDSFHFIMV